MFFRLLFHLPRNILISLIWLYQKTLSPDHSWMRKMFPHGFCRFQPTCSEYGIRALKKYGVIRGVPKIIWRVLRCNPWSCGGVDEP